MSLRTPLRALIAATLATTVLAALPSASQAAAPPPAPTGVAATRITASPGDFVVSWKPVVGVDHYNVSVFNGVTDVVSTVPAGTTSLAVKGSSNPCAQYRLTVGSRDANGDGATSGYVWLKSLAPGGVTGMTGGRSTDATTASASWSAPSWAGFGPTGGYAVDVVRVTDGVTVQRRISSDESEKVGKLDPARQYVIKVSAINEYGSCSVGRVVVGNQFPSSPTSVTATRDAAVPALAMIRWAKAPWEGYTPVGKYLVGYGELKITTWVSTPNPWLALKLDPAVGHVFQIRAVNGSGAGTTSRTVRMDKFGAPGSATQPPSVSLDEANGVVTIGVTGPIGSSTTYPKLIMGIKPTIGIGYTDAQLGQNGAQTVTFSPVPCGNYTVTVTGRGASGDKEFARKVINRCDTGLLSANEWKVVLGQAKVVSAGVVDMPNGSETRVMSTRARSTGDMVLTADANLRSGWGYGVWARASFSPSGAISGYSFQFDPGYKNVDAGFGPAFLLRQWNNGVECGSPLARVKIPASVSLYGTHPLVVVAKGDGLYATIDKVVVFDVPSLAKAIAGSYCNMPAPTGTGIGLRTWGAGTSAVFSNVTLS